MAAVFLQQVPKRQLLWLGRVLYPDTVQQPSAVRLANQKYGLLDLLKFTYMWVRIPYFSSQLVGRSNIIKFKRLTFIISAMAIVLVIACPIAFNTFSAAFSLETKMASSYLQTI